MKLLCHGYITGLLVTDKEGSMKMQAKEALFYEKDAEGNLSSVISLIGEKRLSGFDI